MHSFFKIKPILFISLIGFLGCTNHQPKADFEVFLNEPTMIVNYEQDNTLEGAYLRAQNITVTDTMITLRLNLPKDFYVNNDNCQHWMVGWGSNIPLFDSGRENLGRIHSIDPEKGILQIGELLRGEGHPKENQRIVFWNRKPSGFYNYHKQPIVNPDQWPDFAGNQVHVGAVAFDSTTGKWIMLLNESSRTKLESTVNIYAAESEDWINWKPAYQRRPILQAEDFSTIQWSGYNEKGTIRQTGYPSDIVYYNNKWYLFMDGFCKKGKRHIGIAISDHSMLGPYKIMNESAISPGAGESWDNQSCFYAKVIPFKKEFLLFYSGRNTDGIENLGLAKSKNLMNWKKFEKNPVLSSHRGWKSKKGVSEPTFVMEKNDSIFLMTLGAKEFKMGPWHHYVTRRMYMDKSGNVNFAVMGMFVSTDGGETFVPHRNNPIFTNDFSNQHEDSHLGGNFWYLETDTAELIIYQAKSNIETPRYNILLRERKL